MVNWFVLFILMQFFKVQKPEVNQNMAQLQTYTECPKCLRQIKSK